MPEHPALGLGDRRPGWHPTEGADLDPLGVNGGHGGLEVAELLLLFDVKPALNILLPMALNKCLVLLWDRFSLSIHNSCKSRDLLLMSE